MAIVLRVKSITFFLSFVVLSISIFLCPLSELMMGFPLLKNEDLFLKYEFVCHDEKVSVFGHSHAQQIDVWIFLLDHVYSKFR